jgi:hypothetical protein
MRGAAVPRLLKDRHLAATHLVASLQDALRADGATLAVDYALLPRVNNQAADGVAGAAVAWVKAARLQQFDQLVQRGRLLEAWKLLRSPDLPAAAAPALLLRLADAAHAAGDGAMVGQAAHALAAHAHAYKAARPLAATAVRLEITSLRLGGDDAAASALERQRRFLLAKEDQAAVAACVAASRDAVARPPAQPSSAAGSWPAVLAAWRGAAGEPCEGGESHGKDAEKTWGQNAVMRPQGLWIEM